MTLFGTDGIRGRVGTKVFTQQALIHLGAAIARWAQETYGSGAHVLVASDTRISCDWIKAALTQSMLTYTLTLHDAGVLPTPALAQLLKLNPLFTCALMISASHNAYTDNGIKLLDSTGKISAEDEQRISSYFHQEIIPDYQQFGQCLYYPQAADHYSALVTDHFKAGFLHNKRIVLDTAHGATYSIAPKIFTQLGAEVITLNAAPTGVNINSQCGAVHPEGLQQAVLMHKADAGFAFDGDGDRVIAVSNTGQIKNGDDILALLSTHPTYAQEPVLVGTVMSNQGLEMYLHKRNKQLLRTPVGDKYVSQALTAHTILLGGEQSGHIIIHNLTSTGDGIMSALKVLETMQITHNWSMDTFEKYPQILLAIPVVEKKDLAQEPFASLIAYYTQHIGSGRILVRYSGTESSLRVMVEAQDYEQAHTIAHTLAHKLQQYLKTY